MCHWVLHIWTCGDSFFSKYSPCSFDRAAGDVNSPLNPLHPSITPVGVRTCQVGHALGPFGKESDQQHAQADIGRREMRNASKSKPRGAKSKGVGSHVPSPGRPARECVGAEQRQLVVDVDKTKTVYARDANTGEEIPIPLSEIGKASRFGDETLGESNKCNVFEVVLQRKEPTVCPACRRSPQRLRLPAQARGCFAG